MYVYIVSIILMHVYKSLWYMYMFQCTHMTDCTIHQMTLGGMVFGYVMCNIQSNSPATVEGFRRLKVVSLWLLCW